MSAWAAPGVKCECIANERRRLNDMGLPAFVKGEILTISRVVDWPGYGLMLYFVERSPKQCGHIAGFRPIVTRTQEQDIALFRQILAQTPAEVDA